jgi:hypothetical protein
VTVVYAGLDQVGDAVTDRAEDAETALAAKVRVTPRDNADPVRSSPGRGSVVQYARHVLDGPTGRATNSSGGWGAGTNMSMMPDGISVSPSVHGNSGFSCATTSRAPAIASCRYSMPIPAF